MTIAPRERKFLIGGGIALLVFVLVNYLVVPAVSTQMQVRAEYRDKLQALERYQLVVQGRRRYERRLADADQAFAQLKQQLLPGEKLTLASADLQQTLHKMAGESGVTIASENIHRSKPAEGFTQVSVELSLNADLKKLRDFLYRIETSKKLLTVPKLVVNAAFPRPGAELQVTIVVTGYTPVLKETAETG
ncbi:MAG: type II secretion system protein GspM [Candidatus Methylomirabilaceae bacterium]